MYARVAHYVGDRKTLSDDRTEGLEEIIMDTAKAQAIVEAARMSMGENQDSKMPFLEIINEECMVPLP